MRTLQPVELESFSEADGVSVAKDSVVSHAHWEVQDAAYVTHFVQLLDGSFVMGYHDGLLKIKTPTTERTFPAVHSKLLSLLVLQNGQLVSCHENGRTYCWDPDTLQMTNKFVTGRVSALLELPDGTLAMGLRGSNIVFIDPLEQKKYAQIGTPSLHVGDVLALLPDGELLSGRRDTGVIFIWDMATQKRKRCFRTHADLYALTVLSDGLHLATSHRNGSVYVWNILEERCIAQFSNQDFLIHTMVALPNVMLAVGDAEGNIKIWDVKLMQCLTAVSVKKSKAQFVFPTYVGQVALLSNNHLAYMTNHDVGILELACITHAASTRESYWLPPIVAADGVATRETC